jgi:multisubunit Na+/H+ antiporter MnhB subunit
MGGMNSLLTVSLVVTVIVVILALYLGLKYPKGWSEWPHDMVTTYRYFVSGTLFMLILGLIYWVTRYWDYPIGGKAMVYVAFIAFIVLFVLGLIFPKGRPL